MTANFGGTRNSSTALSAPWNRQIDPLRTWDAINLAHKAAGAGRVRVKPFIPNTTRPAYIRANLDPGEGFSLSRAYAVSFALLSVCAITIAGITNLPVFKSP